MLNEYELQLSLKSNGMNWSHVPHASYTFAKTPFWAHSDTRAGRVVVAHVDVSSGGGMDGLAMGCVGSEMGETGQVRQEVVGTIAGAWPCATTVEADMRATIATTADQRRGERDDIGGFEIVISELLQGTAISKSTRTKSTICL